MNAADSLRAATGAISAALFLLSGLHRKRLITRVARLDDDKLARLREHLHEYPVRPRLCDVALTHSGIEDTPTLPSDDAAGVKRRNGVGRTMSPGRRAGRHSTPVLPAVLGRWGMYEFVEPYVRRLVADHLGVGVEELVPEVSLRDDLAADSLDLVELALALEGRFGIGVPEHILDQVRSYGDLVETTVDLIRSRRAAASRSAEQPARFVARIVPSEGRSGGILEQGGWLTPYTVETIVEDALRAGHGARLEVTVAASTEDTGLARVRDDFACLGQRGVLVTVWREDENGVPEQHPPVAAGATTTARPPLADEATEPAIHMIARRTGTSERPTTTSITLRGTDGQQRVLSP